MAAPRGTKTTLVCGLASCDVALYKTFGEAEKPPKWDLAGPNGGKLSQPQVEGSSATVEVKGAPKQKPNPLNVEADQAFAEAASEPTRVEEPYLIEEDSGEKVLVKNVRRGLRREDGTFSDLTEGLEQITERTKLEEIRVADFIRTEEVRRDRVLGSYWLAPDGPGAPKLVKRLCLAMQAERRVATVKWTKRSKQALGVLIPDPKTGALKVIELAWAEDMREAPEKVLSATQVEVTDEEVDIACQLVQAMSSTRAESLDSQTDDSRALVRELVARAAAGEEFAVPQRPEVEQGADVIDMMKRGLLNRDELDAAAA
jgi:non-homologous end joining protein Ku